MRHEDWRGRTSPFVTAHYVAEAIIAPNVRDKNSDFH